MAFKVLNGYRDIEILMDTAEDLKDLPVDCPIGSIAYTADQSVKATLSPSNVWVQHKSEETSGGSGGSNMVEKVLLDEPEAVFHDNYGTMGANFEFVPALKVGQTYDVEIDGNKFSCVAASISMGDATITYIGNASLIPVEESYDDTGEPFVAASFGSAMSVIVAIPATYDAVDDIVLSIKITTMEEEASGGGMMRINVSQVDDNVYTADKNYVEISEALQAGIVPYCVLGDNFFNLVESDGFAGISTFAMPVAHKFTCLVFNGPWLYCLRIDAENGIHFESVRLSTIEDI